MNRSWSKSLYNSSPFEFPKSCNIVLCTCTYCDGTQKRGEEEGTIGYVHHEVVSLSKSLFELKNLGPVQGAS